MLSTESRSIRNGPLVARPLPRSRLLDRLDMGQPLGPDYPTPHWGFGFKMPLFIVFLMGKTGGCRS